MTLKLLGSMAETAVNRPPMASDRLMTLYKKDDKNLFSKAFESNL